MLEQRRGRLRVGHELGECAGDKQQQLLARLEERLAARARVAHLAVHYVDRLHGKDRHRHRRGEALSELRKRSALKREKKKKKRKGGCDQHTNDRVAANTANAHARVCSRCDLLCLARGVRGHSLDGRNEMRLRDSDLLVLRERVGQCTEVLDDILIFALEEHHLQRAGNLLRRRVVLEHEVLRQQAELHVLLALQGGQRRLAQRAGLGAVGKLRVQVKQVVDQLVHLHLESQQSLLEAHARLVGVVLVGDGSGGGGGSGAGSVLRVLALHGLHALRLRLLVDERHVDAQQTASALLDRHVRTQNHLVQQHIHSHAEPATNKQKKKMSNMRT